MSNLENHRPWETEPNQREFMIDDYRCVIVRYGENGHLCGYVGLPQSHPLHGTHYDGCNMVDVHGGWTFSNSMHPVYDSDESQPRDVDDRWYIGFDCAHYMDYTPMFDYLLDGDVGIHKDTGNYKTIEYVTEELFNAVSQLKNVNYKALEQG